MMKKALLPLLLLALTLAGCQSALLTALVVFKGTDEPPKYDILLKEDKRVVVVPRAMHANSYELRNAPLEIARHVNALLDEKVKNKKLKVVEQSKVEDWLDNCNNDFDSFLEVGRDKSIKADIVIGFDIIDFQIRDPQNAYLAQGKCKVQVKAYDCASGKVLASEDLTIVYPPSMPISGGPHVEARLRLEFIVVIAEHIAALFHHHDPHKVNRIDADALEMHRL